jgi:hypothetical protein
MSLAADGIDALKRKLRRLKKLERAIRFKHRPEPPNARLVWDVFFSTRGRGQAEVKYPLEQLARLDREALKAVFEEYFYRVYYQTYTENGLRPADVYDPQLLALLDLPAHAGLDEIKQRFRALAKRHHPDLGGSSDDFRALMEVYEQLTEGGTQG